MVQAYDARMIVRDYDQLVNESGMSDCIDNPSVERLRALDSEQLLGCIAWHFRRDHFAEGSLISESIADGHMLRMLKEFVKKEDAEIA